MLGIIVTAVRELREPLELLRVCVVDGLGERLVWEELDDMVGVKLRMS